MHHLKKLSRSEMKKIVGGMGCAPSCSGCIANGSIGADPPCYKWECQGGMWCVPVASTCCLIVVED